MPRFRPTRLLLLVALASPQARAQDRRTVTEPRLPAVACATLTPAPGDRAHALERAFARCRGGAVRLSAGRYESGPIEMPAHTILWLDPDATLRAIPDPRLFDAGQGRCGTIDATGRGCRPLLHLADATDAAIMGAGTIDGAGGAAMAGTDESWWGLARRAQRQGGRQNVPRLVVVDRGRDFVVYRTRFADAASFHLAVAHVRGFTAWAVVVDAPTDARNTDGIDPSASEDVLIAHSFISTGDDDIALKAGRSGGVRHVSILDDHLYAGHGLSIGSETMGGVSDVLVRDVTLDGTIPGLRIKSDATRGGVVERIRYENVCLRGNDRPIDLDSRYDAGAAGSAIPVYRDIVLANVIGAGGRLVVRGHDDRHRLGLTLDGVRFARTARWEVANAAIGVGAHGVSPPPPGIDAPPPRVRDDCAAAFLPFPARTPATNGD